MQIIAGCARSIPVQPTMQAISRKARKPSRGECCQINGLRLESGIGGYFSDDPLRSSLFALRSEDQKGMALIPEELSDRMKPSLSPIPQTIPVFSTCVMKVCA